MPKYRLLNDQDKIEIGDEIWLPSWQKRGGWIEVIEMIIGEAPGERIIRRLNEQEKLNGTNEAAGESG